ncbi:MAG: hypothetical protein AB7O78_19275, partial [Thermoleophilia bacterium]
MAGVPDFLIVRGDDLLILGVAWTGFDVTPGPGGPHLESPLGGAPAAITLFLPPQTVAEAKYDAASPADTSVREARIGGGGRLTIPVPGGSRIALTAEALLAAAAMRPLATAGDDAPAIEAPWHLVVAPASSDGSGVLSRHASAPVTSPGGVTGLWEARLVAASGGGPDDAGLILIPAPGDAGDDGLDVSPLSMGQRDTIRAAAEPARPDTMPRARRLHVSALGASLIARQRSPTADWDHEMVVGRDRSVRVLARGVLYPFGHRAVLEESAVRTIRPPDAGQGVAGLDRTRRLTITEPVRSLAEGPREVRRAFPFDHVEVLQTVFTDLQTATLVAVTRVPDPDDDLTSEKSGKEEEVRLLREAFQPGFDEAPHSFEAYLAVIENPDFPTTTGAALLTARSNEALDPAALQRIRDDKLADKRQKSDLITVLEGQEDTAEQIDALWLEIQQLNADLAGDYSEARIAQVARDEAFWDGELARLLGVALAEFQAQDELDEWIALTSPGDAERLRNLLADIQALADRIQAIRDAAAVPWPTYLLPRGSDGRAIRFPLRCAGAAGDVTLSVPMVFVADWQRDAGDHFPAFHSLTDAAVLTPVQAEWAAETGQGVLPLPGARIDMVRAPAPVVRPDGTTVLADDGSPVIGPKPGDVLEIHQITLAAVPVPGGFLPSLTSFEAELPALRGVLPELPTRRRLEFARDFLTGAAVPEMPLRLAEQIDIDFRKMADRAGGLVSPRFLADGISRTLGPVAEAAIPPGLTAGLPDVAQFDPKSVFTDATLLGFPLTALMKLPDDLVAAADQVPRPPAIVQALENGVPTGMTMDWTMPLAEHGPFVPTAASVLALHVVTTLDARETTCRVNDFELRLPPGGPVDGLLTLKFRALTFTQRDGGAPDLEITGMTVGFGGALKLLEKLQKELAKVIDLPGNGPRVQVRETGIAASYGITAPPVTCGAFTLTNVGILAGVDVPFDGAPVTVRLAFATREDPFKVGVLTFGGGGYLDMTLGAEGLMRLEASLEFGAFIEVNFGIANGEVHALGGVRFTKGADGGIDIDGFVKIGGSVEVLGLVSVAIELLVTRGYRAPNRLVGRATLIIEIDVTLFSDRVEIDSGEWVLAGDEEP